MDRQRDAGQGWAERHPGVPAQCWGSAQLSADVGKGRERALGMGAVLCLPALPELAVLLLRVFWRFSISDFGEKTIQKKNKLHLRDVFMFPFPWMEANISVHFFFSVGGWMGEKSLLLLQQPLTPLQYQTSMRRLHEWKCFPEEEIYIYVYVYISF